MEVKPEVTCFIRSMMSYDLIPVSIKQGENVYEMVAKAIDMKSQSITISFEGRDIEDDVIEDTTITNGDILSIRVDKFRYYLQLLDDKSDGKYKFKPDTDIKIISETIESILYRNKEPDFELQTLLHKVYVYGECNVKYYPKNIR